MDQMILCQYSELLTKGRKIVECINPCKTLVVRGKRSFEVSGAHSLLNELFKGFDVDYICDFSENPNSADLQRILEKINPISYQLIVSVGGGSVIDMAKLLRAYYRSDEDVENQIIENRLNAIDLLPLIAIPTTAGTGSESTHFAVVYMNHQKYSLSHYSLLPSYVFLDPSLTYATSSYVGACAGSDALCQAIESFWSLRSTEISRSLSIQAIRMIWRHLYQAVICKKPFDMDQIAYGANLSGRAINISFTTAPHAYSYGITSLVNLPHGHAVSLLMPFFFQEFLSMTEADCKDHRGYEHVLAVRTELQLLFGINERNAQTVFQQFFHTIGLSHLRFSEKEVQEIICAVNIQRLTNHPVAVDNDRLRSYLLALR